ncbi:signal peptidase II [Candidatus Gracilibacteria bacterium]|nr:signal peptidase II [Candidatus Gracilibacteria bacterium]
MFSKNYISGITTGNYVSVLGEYLGFQLSYNPGIAFSLPITGLPLQIITALLVIGLIVYYAKEEYPKNSFLLDTGYGFILAGAISHAYERIFIGYVVDFISIKYFAILNFADIFISIGACFIFFLYYVRK